MSSPAAGGKVAAMSGQQDVPGTLRDMWDTRPARPRDDRKIAGVAAAIARRYEIDPVLVRIAFVVAAFYGGIGFLLYLGGWILLPDAGAGPTDAAGRPVRRSEPHPVLLVLLIILAVGTGSAVLFGGNPGGLVALAVAAGLLYMLHRTRGDRGRSAAAGASPPTGDAPVGSAAGTPMGTAGADTPTTQADTPTTQGATPTTQADTPTTRADAPTTRAASTGQAAAAAHADTGRAAPAADPETAAVPGPGPYGRTEPPAWDPLGAAPFAWDLPEPASPADPPESPRPGAWLTPLTLGLALLAGGVAGAVVLTVGGVGGLRVVFGVVLAVLGLGLLVGAFLRRGRGLIALAIPMILLTYAVTAAQLQDWRGVDDLTAAPTTVAALAPVYERTAGDIRLDLRQLDLSVPTGTDASPIAAGPVSTAVAVDLGSVEVQLPPDADVTVRCEASAGQVDCLGQQLDGPGIETTVTDLGRDGVRSGRPLMLDVSAGLGSVEVHRG
jgi:phage shock protein PspC (stress-responsive transcriptional regulator)